MTFFRKLVNDLLDLFYPRLCLICERQLVAGEKHICLHCLSGIPETGYHKFRENPMERLFFGKTEIERAFAFFYFTPGGDYRKVIHAIKYKGEKEAAATLGGLYAVHLKDSEALNDIDLIIPVPLHPKKKRRRGYNQSEWIAKGIGEMTHIKVCDKTLLRRHNTRTQTKKSGYDRWKNVENAFYVSRPLPAGCRHILLVDDVVTTGATLVECALALHQNNDIKITVLTLGISV